MIAAKASGGVLSALAAGLFGASARRAVLFVSRAFVVGMAQNSEWFEQLHLQHATLPGGILYNGLE